MRKRFHKFEQATDCFQRNVCAVLHTAGALHVVVKVNGRVPVFADVSALVQTKDIKQPRNGQRRLCTRRDGTEFYRASYARRISSSESKLVP